MAAILLTTLFLLILFDAKLLQRKDEDLYTRNFRFYPEKWAFFATFLFVILLPIHLLRRNQFHKQRDKNALLLDWDDSEAGWTMMSDACGIILLWFCFELFGLLIIYGLGDLFPFFESELSRTLFVSVLSVVLIVSLIYRLTRRYPGGFLQNIGLRQERESGALFRTVVVPLMLGITFAFFTVQILENRSVQPSTPLNELVNSTQSIGPILAFLAAAIFVAPLLEEIIFRGYFFEVIRRFRGETASVIIIGTMFGVLHYGQYWGDWMAIVLITLLGFVLTVLRVWGGSLLASIIMHYTYNGCIIAIPVLTLLVSNPAFVQYTVSYPQLSYEQKEDLLQKSIVSNPDFIEAYNDLAWLYAEEGVQFEEALILIEQALEKEPHNSAYLDTKAKIFYKLGRIDEAIEIAEQLVEKHPAQKVYRTRLEEFQESLSIIE